ncbi:MAG: hypothetical protein A3H70_05035 [Candidatus Komeilibacteria bacterium RIFCSPLOWO2_02_FULL_48_11]|uniref:Uncharacterized protein n=1 Tax=Candidatus Komeilibacteria bacterium RIFCSPLOWO2_02_FULL_48_11 TaxID=1798553 RepID=A0A1G2BU70_9BACT|nr:MAG: hypothetical protein A3H70_05035 [Candidatus Komeilibacteria bacterium RIFCSPLOWO2_02_FULL_48_11]
MKKITVIIVCGVYEQSDGGGVGDLVDTVFRVKVAEGTTVGDVISSIYPDNIEWQEDTRRL